MRQFVYRLDLTVRDDGPVNHVGSDGMRLIVIRNIVACLRIMSMLLSSLGLSYFFKAMAKLIG